MCSGASNCSLVPVIVAWHWPGTSNHGLEHDKSTGTRRITGLLGVLVVTGHNWLVLVPVLPVGFHFTDATHFNMANTNTVKCPMAPGAIFSTDQCPTNTQEIMHMCKVPYHEAIGSLMYLAVATRLDLTFTMTTLSQYLNNPGVSHWEGVKRIRDTTSVKLTYSIDQHNLIGYTNTNGVSQLVLLWLEPMFFVRF